jgi:hypothetical protein
MPDYKVYGEIGRISGFSGFVALPDKWMRLLSV